MEYFSFLKINSGVILICVMIDKKLRWHVRGCVMKKVQLLEYIFLLCFLFAILSTGVSKANEKPTLIWDDGNWDEVVWAVCKGDFNDDGVVNLADCIIALQVLAGMKAADLRADYTDSGADVNNDGRIGLEEAIYVLEVQALLR